MTKPCLIVLLGVVGVLSGCKAQNREQTGYFSPDETQRFTRPASTQPAANEMASARPSSSSPPTPPQIQYTVRGGSDAAIIAPALLNRDCRVQLRRDALGMAGAAPIGATQEWGGRVAVAGKVLALTDQWLVLQPQETGRRYCIPVASILLIEVRD